LHRDLPAMRQHRHRRAEFPPLLLLRSRRDSGGVPDQRGAHLPEMRGAAAPHRRRLRPSSGNLRVQGLLGTLHGAQREGSLPSVPQDLRHRRARRAQLLRAAPVGGRRARRPHRPGGRPLQAPRRVQPCTPRVLQPHARVAARPLPPARGSAVRPGVPEVRQRSPARFPPPAPSRRTDVRCAGAAPAEPRRLMDAILTLTGAWLTLLQLLEAVWRSDWIVIALKFFPFVLLFELPIQALVMLGGVRRYIEGRRTARYPLAYHPSVSCVITCYSEGADVQKTVRSLTEQLYDGPIEMLAVVDGAVQNRATLTALRALQSYVKARKLRRLEIVPKLQRG